MPEDFRVFPSGRQFGPEGVARDMIRISTIFIAICMVLVAASLGLVLYSVAGISGTESAIVALTALTFLILYNAVSMRLRDRTDVGGQIADLSRGTADLARQVAEFGRRLAAIEGRVVSANSAGADRIQAVVGEINELGVLVKQLAASVASHEDLLAARRSCRSSPRRPAGRSPNRKTSRHSVRRGGARSRPRPAPAAALAPARRCRRLASPSRSQPQLLAAVKNAIEENRLDIYLQPMVTLPQRKVRFYEAVTRLRDDKDQILAADDFIGDRRSRRADRAHRPHGDAALCPGAAPPDGAQQGSRRVLQRLRGDARQPRRISRNASISSKPTARWRRPSCSNSSSRRSAISARPRSSTSPALAQRGYRFSIDHVTDLRIEPRELADRGVRFIKVPAALLLDPKQSSTSDIHPSDLSDLLGRFGIDLIAEKIEGERAVVDLLDYDVRFGQGFLFAPAAAVAARGSICYRRGHAAEQGSQSSNASEWLQQPRSRRPAPTDRASAASDRQCRAGAPRRRSGLTALDDHDHASVCRTAARPRRWRRGDPHPTSGAWCITGSKPFPEACEALHTFRERGGTVILITNAPRPADSVQRQLRKLGVADETYDAIVSSGDLTRHFVADHPGKKLFWLGPERDNSIHRGLDPVLGAAGAGRLHHLHRPVRRRNRNRPKTIAR